METGTDQHFFTEEWFIENVSYWNLKIHGKAIAHKNVIVDQLNFRLELYPKGRNGQEENMVVGVYDENLSNGELSVVRSDGSLLCKLEVKDPDWNECYALVQTEIKFEDIVRHFVENPFHADVLALRYRKPKSFEVLFRVRNKIEVIETSIEIPASRLEGLPWTDPSHSILNFSVGGKLTTLQLVVSTLGSDCSRISFAFTLMSKLKNNPCDQFLIRSCVRLLNGSRDSLALEEKEHFFLHLLNWNFTYLRSGGELEKGVSLLVRLKFVTGIKRDNYTSCWFQPQELNIMQSDALSDELLPRTIRNTIYYCVEDSRSAIAGSVKNHVQSSNSLCVEDSSEFTDCYPVENVSEITHENLEEPQTQVTKSDVLTKECFPRSVNDVNTDQADCSKSVSEDFSGDSTPHNNDNPNCVLREPLINLALNSTKPDVQNSIQMDPSVLIEHSDYTKRSNANDIGQQFNTAVLSHSSDDKNFPTSVKDSTDDKFGYAISRFDDFSENKIPSNSTLVEKQINVGKLKDPSDGKNFQVNVKDAVEDKSGCSTRFEDFYGGKYTKYTNSPNANPAMQQFNTARLEVSSDRKNLPITVKDALKDSLGYVTSRLDDYSRDTSKTNGILVEHQFDNAKLEDPSNALDFPVSLNAATSISSNFQEEKYPEDTKSSKDINVEYQSNIEESNSSSDGRDFPPSASDDTAYRLGYATSASALNSFSEKNPSEDTTDSSRAEKRFEISKSNPLSGETFTQTVRDDRAASYLTSFFKNPNDSSTVFVKLLESFRQDHPFPSMLPLSDFQLCCGNTTFLVHRVVLSCQSLVFKSLLSDNDSDSMDISDLDADTLSQFLFYLYTGSADNMLWDCALKLYRAAELYQVPSLKSECCTVLRDNVSVSNVSEVLLLADQYKDEVLEKEAYDFILENYFDVLSSKEWKLLKKKNRVLLCKTLTNLAHKVMLEQSKCFSDFE